MTTFVLTFDPDRLFSPETSPVICQYLRGERKAIDAAAQLNWTREEWDRHLAGIFSVALHSSGEASSIRPPAIASVNAGAAERAQERETRNMADQVKRGIDRFCEQVDLARRRLDLDRLVRGVRADEWHYGDTIILRFRCANLPDDPFTIERTMAPGQALTFGGVGVDPARLAEFARDVVKSVAEEAAQHGASSDQPEEIHHRDTEIAEEGGI